MKYCLVLITALSCWAGPAELNVQILSVKAEALYWPGQAIKGENRQADRLDYYELPALMQQNSPTTLNDGDYSWNASWKTYFWSQQPKRLSIIADLGQVCLLEKLEVWQGGLQQKGNLIEKVAVFGALEMASGDLWDGGQILEQKQPEKAQKQEAYPLTFHFADDYRYLKIVCSSQLSAMMVLSEIKAYGKSLQTAPAPLVLPPHCYRFEMEQIPGTFALSNVRLLDEKGCFITSEHSLELELPPEAGLPLYSFMRYLDNGSKSLEWEINGEVQQMPATDNQWVWRAGPKINSRNLKLIWRRLGEESGLTDSIIFSSDPDFPAPDTLELGQLKKIPALAPALTFAQKLLQDRPDIPAAEFARLLATHHGYESLPRQRVIDDNNNILYQGKPFFQLGFYHVQPGTYLDDTPVNTYISGNTGEHSQAVVISHLPSLRAYDVVAERLKKYDRSRIVMHYLVDEPDGHIGITLRDIELLDALVKALCPENATFLNFAANSTMHKAFNITDVIGLDHYPIPYGRIADIAFTMDAMRYYSNNRPVIFVPQAFSWKGYGRQDGRWPTAEELSAMTFMGLVHGAKGLLFYEFPAPKMNSKTSIKEINPQLWDHLEQLLSVIEQIIPGLLGPEVALPWGQTTSADKQNPEFRLLLSESRDQAWLLAVNPWDRDLRCSLSMQEDSPVLKSLQALTAQGVSLEQHEKTLDWHFGPFATAVYRLDCENLHGLVKLSHEQLLSQLGKKFQHQDWQQKALIKVQKGASLDWAKATDLLDSWKSINRPEKALLSADASGLHVQSVIRFPAGQQAKFQERDSDVWRDPGIELFLGIPGESQYVHLMINTLNTQADWIFDSSRAKPLDKTADFVWQSSVDAAEEIAAFQITIPWSELKKMLRSSEITSIAFNIASTAAMLDWAGLSGSGFHAPASFGILSIEP